VPQVGPIEIFWAILKRKVYLNGLETEWIDDLIKNIKKVEKYAIKSLPEPYERPEDQSAQSR